MTMNFYADLQTLNSVYFIFSVCLEMRKREGIAAIFGQTSRTAQAHLQLISNATNIPHIEAIWNPQTSRLPFSISVYPNNEELYKAFADIIKHWHWKIFTVIYEDRNSKKKELKCLLSIRVCLKSSLNAFRVQICSGFLIYLDQDELMNLE